MTPERWRQIRDVLDSALQLEGAERSAFLDRNCSRDPSLRQELDSLLAAERKLPSDFLPTAELLAPVRFLLGQHAGGWHEARTVPGGDVARGRRSGRGVPRTRYPFGSDGGDQGHPGLAVVGPSAGPLVRTCWARYDLA
jgi:hypothetical protein